MTVHGTSINYSNRFPYLITHLETLSCRTHCEPFRLIK